MSFDRYSHENRARAYGLPDQSHSQPSSLNSQAQQFYPREVPRYDPSFSRLNPPQILGHSHTEGSSGGTFSVPVSDISHDPRTYKFVFGQRKVGAFLERSRRDDTTSVLSAQVPKFADTKWWSNRVPVYLLVSDSQTDENIHSVQICEFTYIESPTPSPLKRPREELANVSLRQGSPVKRSSSQPAQQAPAPYYNPLPAPSYQASYNQGSAYQMGSQHDVQRSGRDIPMPVPYPVSASLAGYEPSRLSSSSRDSQQNRFVPSPLSLPESNHNRYIAEPQDHYSIPSSHHEYLDSTQQRQRRTPPATTPTSYYQSSIASSPATWKSPYHSASNVVYASSPPPPSTTSGSELPYEAEPLTEDPFDPNAPTLQRTSTLSSGQSTGGPPVPTSTSAQAGWLPSSKAKLEVLGNLDDMSRNWSAEEFSVRRRLVQFWRKQEGNVVKINFRPVEISAPKPPHAIVISCIYWEERQECFFTSVDAIFLLESLVGNKFAVEEKNRIRRNLEGFRPLTVSKGKSDSETFFKLIMGFPAPKPRNIEKDVKAFPWRILTSALRKIIGKYSASYEGLTERTGNDSVANEGSSTPVGASGDMPPPSLRRQVTVESSTSSADAGPSQSQRVQMQPGQLPEAKEVHVQALPRVAADRAEPSTSRPQVPSPRPGGGLQIKVPQLADNLPVLDGAVPSSNDFERRSSGLAGFPMSGISNVDFSEFFQQSPGNQAASGSGWPSLSSLFPPPSAGFSLDNPPPRRD